MRIIWCSDVAVQCSAVQGVDGGAGGAAFDLIKQKPFY